MWYNLFQMKPKSEKTNILLASPIYLPDIGGPATYTKELAHHLEGSQKYSLTILTYANRQTAPLLPGTKLYVVNKDLPLPIRLCLFTAKLIFLSFRSDLIYVQNAVAAGLPTFITSKLTGISYVLKFVGDEAWERVTQTGETKLFLEDFLESKEKVEISFYPKLIMKIQGVVLRGAKIVTTPSMYLGQALIKNYNVCSENFKVNYNASEDGLEKNIEEQKIPNQILVTARLTKWKGIDGVIDAVKILKEKKGKDYSDLKLVVCGDGPELANLQQKTNKLGLSDTVSFLGRVSREETYRLRKVSEIYVLNSTYEGLPHTALTSFQAKIPMIATNTPGTNEAVYDNVSGLLTEVNNPEMLAEKIDLLLSDKDLQKKIVEGGTKILKEKFSWESHLKNLEVFFDKLISK